MPATPDAALPEELRRAFSDRDLIVCLGSGASTDAGLPSSRDLALSLVTAAHTADPGLDVAALQARAHAGRVAEVLQLAQRSLGAAFVREVQALLSDQGTAPPPLLAALAERRDRLRAIYTVRLDRLLERALAGRWPSFAAARPDLAQRRGVVFKLLGTLAQPETWVLTQSQVSEALGPGAPRREAFATAFAAHVMLFVGFDPDDAELAQLLDLAPASEAGGGPGHFIVAPQCTPDDRALLTGRGLQVIDAEPLAVLSALGDATSSPAEPPTIEASPYPGAAPLTESLAPAFFGRHADVSDAASRLGPRTRWLSIEGPDGVGKTSFVFAGLVPALRRGFSEVAPERWIIASVAGHDDPRAALTDALCQALGLEDRQTLAEALAASAGRFVDCLALHVPEDAALLLVIDPLDDLLAAPTDDRAAVIDALQLALRREALHLVTTLRQTSSATERHLPEAFSRAARHRMRPLGRVGLRDAIIEPAALLGVRVEPPLADALIDETNENLPAIALTMAGLWTKAVLADKIVSAAELSATGGAAGALRRHAERTVQVLPVDQRAAATSLLASLVTLDGDGVPSGRALAVGRARAEFGADVVDALQSGGLLAVRGSTDAPVIEPQHLALLRDWPRLRDALAPPSAPDEAPAPVPTPAVPESPRRFGPVALAVVALLAIGGVVLASALRESGTPTPKPGGDTDSGTIDPVGGETTPKPPKPDLGDPDATTTGAPATGTTGPSDSGERGSSSGPPPPDPPKVGKKPCYVHRGDYRKLPTKKSRAGMHCEIDRDSRKPLPAGCSRRYVCE